MHPTHHVHISTGFMFVCLLFIVVIVALFVWLSWSKRQALLRNLQIQQEHEERMEQIRRGHDDQIARRVTDNMTRPSSVARIPVRASVPPARAMASSGYGSVNAGSSPSAPVIVNTGASRGSDNGFMEGALLGSIAGSILGGRDHDTVIERDVSAPAPAPAPDPFAGSGSDAGSSGGGFDYNSGGGDSGGGFDCSSGGGDSGGGFDCSSGGSDGGGCDF